MDLMHLQHRFYCPGCQKPTKRANILLNDNKIHQVCLECGETYIIHQLADDYDFIPAPVGAYPECLMPKEVLCGLQLEFL